MAEIKKRKSKLKDDLELLEGSFENRITKLKVNFFGTVKPSIYIQKKPFIAVGLAVVAGLVAGLSKKKKKKKKNSSSNRSDESVSNGVGFGGLLFNEIKKIAAKRSAVYISKMIEQKISENK